MWFARRSARALSFTSVLAIAMLAACQSTAPAGATPTPAHSRTTILAAEWQNMPVTNLYEVVEHLHPEWLAQRNSMTAGRARGLTDENSSEVSVYVDNERAGNTGVLKSLQLGSASAMHYFSAAESQARFGTSNLNGVIQVVTMR